MRQGAKKSHEKDARAEYENPGAKVSGHGRGDGCARRVDHNRLVHPGRTKTRQQTAFALWHTPPLATCVDGERHERYSEES